MSRFRLQLTQPQIEILSQFEPYEPRRTPGYYESLDIALIYSQNYDFNERQLRRLYGIVSNVRGTGIEHGHQKGVISFYFIPTIILTNVKQAIDSKSFEISFEDSDLNVLRAVYKRSLELGKLCGRYCNPEFHENEIAKQCKINPLEAKESLDRLIGLLQLSLIREKTGREFTIYYHKRRWILPRARLEDAEKILGIK